MTRVSFVVLINVSRLYCSVSRPTIAQRRILSTGLQAIRGLLKPSLSSSSFSSSSSTQHWFFEDENENEEEDEVATLPSQWRSHLLEIGFRTMVTNI